MEVAGFLKRFGLALVAACAVGVAFPLPARDYEISAHAALTEAIINKYNAAYPDAEIDAEFRFDLIRGSKEEDDDNRFLNHFYDPVRDRGLSFGGKSWMRSKSWAEDDANAFTWTAGLEAYAREDYHRAFLILGHVLHLLEDAAVPEHVRNDMHLLDSPYEAFTKTLVPAPDKASPIVLGSLGDYFDAMAAYTNAGFYSADTIGDAAYPGPKPDYVAQEGRYRYGFKRDAGGGEYHLVHYVTAGKYEWASIADSYFLDHEGGKILADYWRLLSAKAVRYGAGMARSFIAEGEKLKKERAAAKRPAGTYATLASALDIFDGLIGSAEAWDDGLMEAEDIPLEADTDGDSVAESRAAASSAATKPSASAAKAPAAVPKKTAVKTAPPKACAYVKAVTPTRGPVIINEVAWMGSQASASDEWVELKNLGDAPAVIGGWQLLSKRGNVSAVIPAGATVPAHGLYLLERTDDASVPGIAADFVYVGSLANADDGLRLLDGNCKVADDVLGIPSWPAGEATARRTMERAQDFSWHSYSGAGASGIFGTPRAENGPPPAIKAGSASGGSSASSGAVSAQAPAPQAASASAAESAAASAAQGFSRGDVIVNELMFDRAGSDAGNEFVELYNATDAAIDLTGWSLQVASGAAGTVKKKNFDDGLSIPANGCFLAWLGNPPADARPQFIWSSGTLNNTAATVYVSAGTDTVQGSNDASVVDAVSYVADAIPGFAAGMSAERVGETDAVRARVAPSPGSCVRLADDEPVPNGGASGEGETAAPFTVPAITFYKNPAAAGSLIDVKWDSYPFIPPTDAGTWGAMAFYLNGSPDGKAYLTSDDQFSTGSAHAVRIQYMIIRAGDYPWKNVLVLPDIVSAMSVDNGLHSASYNYHYLAAEKTAHVIAPATEGKTGDYITVGYYRFSHGGGGSQNLDLVYADPKKIYFK